MSEMFAVRVEREGPGEAVLEVQAVHPDAGCVPLPGHRPAWACALLSAVELAPEEMSPERVWRVADTLDEIRLLDVRNHPRTSSSADSAGPSPTIRVRVTLKQGARLFDFAENDFERRQGTRAIAEGWGAAVASTDGAAIARLAPNRHLGEERVEDLVEAGRRGQWSPALRALMARRSSVDIVPIVLDHVNTRASVEVAHVLADPRLDEAVVIALGDPQLMGPSAIAVALASDRATDHTRSVLARAIEAYQNADSVFHRRIAPNQITPALLDWAGARVLKDTGCVRRLRDLPTTKMSAYGRGMTLRGVALSDALDTAPERRDEIVDSWPGARDYPELAIWAKQHEKRVAEAAKRERRDAKPAKKAKPAKRRVTPSR